MQNFDNDKNYTIDVLWINTTSSTTTTIFDKCRTNTTRKKKTKEIKKNKKDGRKDRQRFGIFMGLKF